MIHIPELQQLPRIALANLPTPIVELPRLSRILGGPLIYMKRDDLTGLATGGNKARKLEFLMADALAKEADVVLTAGAAQSNHCRQTAAAAAHCGLECCLILAGNETVPVQGNLLLDHLLGAKFTWTGADKRGAKLEAMAEEMRSAGRKPYIIPYGGSNPLGAAGYVAAMLELLDQLAAGELEIGTIVFASSSGGTQTGLVVGAKAAEAKIRLLGISIDEKASDIKKRMVPLARGTAELLKLDLTFSADDFEVNDDYLGEGYGVVGYEEREAIILTARKEGLLLDPVYTGRAMAGLIDIIRRQKLKNDKPILFWHTGGTEALEAYGSDLLPAFRI